MSTPEAPGAGGSAPRRLEQLLLLVLLVAVLGVGVVTWRADQRAREADRRMICLQRAEATAVVAQLAPAEAVDAQGRLDAVRVLGDQVDAC